MAPNLHKKNPDYSILCGLRRDSSSSSSTTPTPSNKDESDITAIKSDRPGQQKQQERPQSLTLPFDNRERESHLVSEEDFDRIAREAQAENTLPPVPAHFRAESPNTALRRSISTARNTKSSLFAGRPQSMSKDLSNSDFMTSSRRRALNEGDRTRKASRSLGLPRDPSSLTALPKAPTTNDLADYQDINQTLQCPSSHYTDALRTQSSAKTPNLQAILPVIPKSEGDKEKKGHKRGFSLSINPSGVFDSVKKRLKLGESPTRAGNTAAPLLARFVTQGTNTSGPYVDDSETEGLSRDHAASSSAIGQGFTSGSTIAPGFQAPLASGPEILRSNNATKRSILGRAFSLEKKQPAAQPRPRPKISSPLAMNPPTPINRSPIQQARREADQALIDAIQAGLARRNGSVPNPISDHVSDAFRGTSPSSTTGTQTSDPRMGTPEPSTSNTEPRGTHPLFGVIRKAIPPTKAQLETTVARQQSRIQDLSALNSTLIGQVERLNDQLAALRVQEGRASSGTMGPREQALGSPVEEAGARKRVWAPSRDLQVRQFKRAREEEEEDKRKTWMTVDSEE